MSAPMGELARLLLRLMEVEHVDTIRVLLVVCNALQNAQDVLAARLDHIFTAQVPKPSPVRL